MRANARRGRGWTGLALTALALAGAAAAGEGVTDGTGTYYIFAQPSTVHSNRDSVAGAADVDLRSGELFVDNALYAPNALVSQLYTTTNNGGGIYGTVAYNAANPDAVTTANALASVAGAGTTVQDLYDRGLYVTAAGTGSGGDYVVVSNLALNQSSTYNAYAGEPGAMSVPVVVFGENNSATILATYRYSPGVAPVHAYDPGADNPRYVAVDANAAVRDQSLYALAAVSNASLFDFIYQGNCFDLDPVHAYDDAFAASDSQYYADYIHARAAQLQSVVTGEIATVIPTVQLESLNRFTGVVKEALTVAHTSAVGFAPATSLQRSGYDIMGGWRVWANLGALYGKRDADSKGMSHRFEEYGVTLGADKRLGADNIVVGLAAGYGWGDFRASHSSIKTYVDTFHVELYAGAHWNRLFANAGVGYSVNSFRKLNETVMGLQSNSFDADAWNAFAEVGYRFEFCNYTFLPTVGIDYARLSPDAFHMGNGTFGERLVLARPDRVTSIRTPVELAVMRDFDGLIGALRAGWTHEWSSDDVTSTTSLLSDAGTYNSFGIKGRDLPKNVYNLGLTLDFNINRFATSILYDYYFGSDYHSHGLNFRAGISF